MDPSIHYGYADTKLGQIHYREAGSGPPLILFHESPLSGIIYDAALPLLGRHLHAIAPDMPGYGSSESPPAPLSIAELTHRLALLLDEMHLDKVALVGNHTGAAIAIQMAADLPDRVQALIVVGAPLFDDADRHQWLVENNYLEPFPLSIDGSHLPWLWARYERIWGKGTPVETLHLATTEFLRVGQHYDWAYKAAFMFDAASLLPKVKCPTLFLVTKGDMLRDRNEAALAMTPNSEEKIIDNPWGQLPHREPQIFADESVAFLRKVGYLS
jgi:pimeloyl-ACP methyl ester carboxylesterase